jgi:hypothetical protein
MGDTRTCEQCGTQFAPLREHGRFCSPGCRAAWNCEHSGDLLAEVRALEWSAAGMRDVTGRLSRTRPDDQAAAVSMVGDAVWWVTIVDARLIRHYLGVYDRVLTARTLAERRTIEGTLAGLRFVRNLMAGPAGGAAFIAPPSSAAGTDGGLGAWTWQRLPDPSRVTPPRVRSWEVTRHRAYERWLAGRTVGQVFGRVTSFLESAAAQATSAAHTGAFATPTKD